MEEDVRKLKEELGQSLTRDTQIKRPEGIPTGLQELDNFLLWKGFPKGALTALTGDLGLGRTSLWLEAAAHVTRQGRWAAWVNREAQLFPPSLRQRELDLSRLVTIEAPEAEKKLLWLLQELMASTLFEVIGCDLGSGTEGSKDKNGRPMKMRDHQLRKLQMQARSFNTALVFFAGRERFWDMSLFSLVIDFKPKEIRVERALHKPTPFGIPRRITYANFISAARNTGPFAHLEDRTGLSALRGLQPRALPDPATLHQRR